MKPSLKKGKKKSVLNKSIHSKVAAIPKKEAKLRKDQLQKTSSVEKSQAEPNAFTIVAIGASAGGLEAITEFLKNLSPNTGMAFIYVQHLSPDHKSMLSSLLSKTTIMKVQDVEDMDKMEPNNVYIMPYNKGIEVTDGHIKLLPRQNKSFILSIDVLFSSLAETHKDNVIGIVLSGSGHDGTLGLKQIKEAGGIIFAQNETAKFSSMPESAIAEGIVDFVLSPKQIATKLNWMSKHPLITRKGGKLAPEDEIDNRDPYLKVIMQLLDKNKQVDFSRYKMNTIKRRILRRMLILKITDLKQYSEILKQKKDETDLLYADLLINVTEFFRDPDAFVRLKNIIFPKLLKSKKQGESLRIWVAACATGEEVYSFAMLLFEIQDTKVNKIPFQIFASDLSTDAINQARIGEYSVHQLKNVSSKRLQHFFTKSRDKYRVIKSLRDVCIFAPHNILRDPPFSRVDFISCRNLLIYLDTTAQKKAISTFHYALNDKGFLMLGKSETIGSSTQLFTASPDKKIKIYIRKKDSSTRSTTNVLPRIQQKNTIVRVMHQSIRSQKIGSAALGSLGNAFDLILLSNYVPASIVINHDLDILQFRGQTALYLQNSTGRASLNVLKMVHPEITFELRNAIHHAIKTKQTVNKTGIEVNRDKAGVALRIVNLEVSPLIMEGEEELLIIIFTGQQSSQLSENSIKDTKNNSLARDRRIKKLEEEIAASRLDMATITHDQEAANEELQSANEEIVSSNEELQSLNEELETSKEEIESTNEELITTNQELQARILEVEELYNYYEIILSTIHEPMLIIDKDMRVKSANKSFCALFKITEEKSTGVSLFSLNNRQWNIPRLRELLDNVILKNKPFQDFEAELNLPVSGKKTLLLNAHGIVQQSNNEELIVLTISDVTQIKKLAFDLRQKEKKVLEVKLEVEKKAMKKIEKINCELIQAKNNAEHKTEIAENAVKAKQQFLSNMSHEIRTPMNAIIGFTNVVLKTQLNDSQKEYINAIKLSGDSLIILINDILDIAKVDAGKMTFEQIPFNLSHSITAILHLFEIKILEKNLELIKEYDDAIPEILIGDPLRLRQIILNLLSNAVKFTHTGKIIISIRLIKEDEKNTNIEFTIADTGIGIPENKLKNVFNSFEQASRETSRSYGGSGLGLAIVKQLVELQGGTIALNSVVGEGSSFSFVLDFEKLGLSTEFKTNETETLTKDTLLKTIKVLVAEDIALNQLLIKLILTDFGFEFDIVSNGKLAIDLLKKNVYDVVLMDLQMPEMNGFEATEHIRKEMHSNIPIIALTADVTSMDDEKCKKLGVTDYISKPVDEKLLYSKIVRLVSKSDSLVHSNLYKKKDL
ncbi:chemotaxis protein CheB [Aurantibacillus circumpalustris]|uniref:chemotaxis protein CheB n=1 Tax=Aurantibacillus circumpalustris TaxID=3036359 RepID=UPI00295B7A8A|nr:chemotaxis protein CheB [Aurantibacillus circumpalustris]